MLPPQPRMPVTIADCGQLGVLRDEEEGAGEEVGVQAQSIADAIRSKVKKVRAMLVYQHTSTFTCVREP